MPPLYNHQISTTLNKTTMANALSYEQQITLWNRIHQAIENLQQLPEAILTQRPSAKAWSVAEVIAHMYHAYMPHYDQQLERVLQQAKDNPQGTTKMKPSWRASLMWKMMRPKEGKRPFKMKTFKRFEPKPADLQGLAIIPKYLEAHKKMKAHLLASREVDSGSLKLPSAIGPLVSFTLPEAFEFLLSHEQRHLQQIHDTLAVVMPQQHRTATI